MSEFSESYHLRSDNAEDACKLLRDAGLAGFVFPPTDGWVTFVAEEGRFEPDPRIVAAARQPLLHYVSAEDHGWSFALFESGRLVSAYACDWDEDVSFDDSKYSRAAIQQIIPSANAEALDEFEEQLRPSGTDEFSGSEPSKIFAEAVGLENYDWLAYHYVAMDAEQSEKVFENIIRIP